MQVKLMAAEQQFRELHTTHEHQTKDRDALLKRVDAITKSRDDESRGKYDALQQLNRLQRDLDDVHRDHDLLQEKHNAAVAQLDQTKRDLIRQTILAGRMAAMADGNTIPF